MAKRALVLIVVVMTLLIKELQMPRVRRVAGSVLRGTAQRR
ncbi:hypothetical protein [Woeseia oceani]|nr:hypothetical protein [Woeseia oceani]